MPKERLPWPIIESSRWLYAVKLSRNSPIPSQENSPIAKTIHAIFHAVSFHESAVTVRIANAAAVNGKAKTMKVRLLIQDATIMRRKHAAIAAFHRRLCRPTWINKATTTQNSGMT